MQRPLLLSEARSRNDADARGVEEAEAVEFVRGAVLLFCLFDGAGGEVDGWVEVHCALVRCERVIGNCLVGVGEVWKWVGNRERDRAG